MNDDTPVNEPSFLVEKTGEITRIRFNHDSFDRVEVQEIRDALREVIHQTQPPYFVIDFAHVAFLSSVILGVIMGIHLNICNRQGHLRICGMNELTRRVFHITKLDKVLTILPSAEDAVADLKQHLASMGDKPSGD